MKKKLYKDITLKSGGLLPKGSIVEIQPSALLPLLASVEIDGQAYTLKYKSVIKPPIVKTLEKWEYEGFSKTIAGKKTEPDGYDEDGFPSWLLALGYI